MVTGNAIGVVSIQALEGPPKTFNYTRGQATQGFLFTDTWKGKVSQVLLKEGKLIFLKCKNPGQALGFCINTEEVGFEPTVGFPTSVFKTDAIGHSATLP